MEDISKMEEVFGRDFQNKYKEGRLIGWDQNTVEHFDSDKAEYCSTCNKLFISN